MLQTLTEDLWFIIFMAGKNLGPCIMERERYIQKSLTEHLEKGNAYKRLTKQHAYNIRISVEQSIQTWYHKHHKHLPDNEATYLKRAYIDEHKDEKRIAQF